MTTFLSDTCIFGRDEKSSFEITASTAAVFTGNLCNVSTGGRLFGKLIFFSWKNLIFYQTLRFLGMKKSPALKTTALTAAFFNMEPMQLFFRLTFN